MHMHLHIRYLQSKYSIKVDTEVDKEINMTYTTLVDALVLVFFKAIFCM